MFDDPTLIGSWTALAARLEGGVLRGWATADVRLAEASTVEDLLAAWADPAHTHAVGAGLVELAAADGGREEDALLVLLHLLSGVVWRLSSQLADLSPDITLIVIGELTCQIRTYRWQVRTGGLVTNLEKDTRRAVLAELRPSNRYHPDRVEQLTWTGDLDALQSAGGEQEDLDLVDLLMWAAAAGVDQNDLQLLVESERARGRRGARADERVAATRGIARRTLLRRRQRVLTALQALAPDYLRAVA